MTAEASFSGTDASDGEISGSDLESERNGPPLSKTRKLDGAAKYPTKFNSDWTKRWPCIQPATKYKFRCTICQCLISCEHQGEKDVRRHLDGKKHRDNAESLENQQRIGEFFRPTNHPLHEKVIRAEVKMSTVLAHHNIPIAVSDHLSPLFKDIFPDSEIAKAYSCARTKTTCILNGALAVHFQASFVDHMKAEPFALATDGSNDSGLQKMNPLTVRIFDINRGRVTTQLLDMCLTSSSTAESIYSKIDYTLKQFDVDWEMCVAFGVDNTSVNIGRRNSIKSRVLQESPSTYFVGCPCHMVHNTATKAAESFEAETGFDVEDMLVDLYYWFDKSTKRKNELSEYCEFCDVRYRAVIKHVSTRWLSLEYAVERTLQQYPALRSYFLSSHESQARFQRLQQLLDNPMTEVYLMFYQAVLPVFTSFNKFLQRETPCIHVLYDKLDSFVNKLLGKFVKISIIRDAKDQGNLIDADFDSKENQLPDSNIFVGFMTKQIQQLLNDGDIANSEVTKFYAGVRRFYTTATEYIKSTYPLKDDLLLHAKFVNFEKRDECGFDSVEYFVNRFSLLQDLTTASEMELLQEEFISYQLLSDSDIPSRIWDEAKVGEDEDVYYRVDILWKHLCQMQRVDSSELKFHRLIQVAKVVLVIPHSNASEERVFSMVRKNKTPFRPSLSLDGTLSSIITVKLGVDDPCEKFEPGKELLVKAKKSTWEYNKTHSSKKKS